MNYTKFFFAIVIISLFFYQTFTVLITGNQIDCMQSFMYLSTISVENDYRLLGDTPFTFHNFHNIFQ